MDFLRASDLPRADPRFFGLTGGQYASMAALALALWVLRRTARSPEPAR